MLKLVLSFRKRAVGIVSVKFARGVKCIRTAAFNGIFVLA